MASETINVKVRHRLGFVGNAAVFAAMRLAWFPMFLVVWAVEHSTYVRVGDGPWVKMRLGLRPEEF